MRAAARTIVEALTRFPSDRREDRLTEVFAHTLQTASALTDWLIGRVDTLPPRCQEDPVEIFTQGAITGSGRPDLRVKFKDVSGRHRVLLSEHKIDSPLTSYQTEGYPGWNKDALILIAPHASPQRSGFNKCLTWLDVAEELIQLGDAYAGKEWRAVALEPQAPSSLRCLHELLTLLEIEDVGVNRMDAIDDAAVTTYAMMADVRDRLETFLRLIARDARLQHASELYNQMDRTQWWFEVPNVTWPLLHEIEPGAVAHVALESTGTWLGEPDGWPILYTGFYFETPERDIPRQLDNQPVHRALAEIGAKVAIQPNRRQGKCVKTLRLSDIAAQASTLPRQAEAAATFAVETLGQISSIAL